MTKINSIIDETPYIRDTRKEFLKNQFYLDDVLFQAKPNMTWDEWLNSNYSDGWKYKGKTITYDEVKTSDNTGCFPFDSNKTWTQNGYFVIDNRYGGVLMLYTSNSYKTDYWNSSKTSAAEIIKRNELIKATFEQANYIVPSDYISDANDNYYYIEIVKSVGC